jgi:hypothetical protein
MDFELIQYQIPSSIWIGLYFANLVFPEQPVLFLTICFPPMILAGVSVGFYLMLFAVKTEGDGNRPAEPSTRQTSGSRYRR